MDKYINTIKHINYALFLAVFAALPFPRQFAQVIWIAWMITWALELRFLHRDNLRWDKTIIPVIMLAAWVIWESISLLWGHHIGAGGHFKDAHVSLLILPLIALYGVNELYDWKQIAKVLICSCLASILVYTFTIYWVNNVNYIQHNGGWPQFGFYFRLYDYMLSPIKHRLYYCTLLTLSMVLTEMLRPHMIQEYGRYRAYAYYAIAQCGLLYMIIGTYSRASLFTLMVVAGIAILRHTPVRHRWAVALVTTIVMVGGALAVWQLHPRMRSLTIADLTNLETHMEDNEKEPRLLIWKIATEHPEQYAAYGMGVGNATPYLIDRYQQLGLTHYAYKQYATHNQYLEIAMELGVVAVLCFMAIWVAVPLCQNKDSEARRFAVYLGTVFGVNMLTDCLLSRIEGVVYICAFLLLISCLSQDRSSAS